VSWFRPSQHLNTVVPAKAGTHLSAGLKVEAWIPAFAGMTKMADLIRRISGSGY
jgi:hypothetical protein